MKFCSRCKKCFDDDAAACSCGSSLSDARPGGTGLIDGYRLEYLLESGVRGQTYRASRLDCGRSCLIKIVKADDATAAEMLRETAIAQSLFHHGIADIYEAERLNETEVYVVSEAPEAQTLRERLDETGTPELLTAIGIARQTAEAVHALHVAGLKHRAINPANIFLSTDHDGELLVRVANIDLAGAATRAIVSNKFLIDTAIDSLRYFSPEQCTGKEATEKTDLYALGVVLFEMLAGSPPFDAANASGLIEKHLSMHPPEIKIDNFELRALLSHTLIEALQKQPSLRQSSADLFARQIRHMELLATHVSTPAPAVAMPAEAPKAKPVHIVTVPNADLDLPSIEKTEAEQAVFTPTFVEPEQPAVPDSPARQPRLIRLDDSYSETLGPLVRQPEPEEPKASRLTRAKSRQKGIRTKAVEIAGGILEKAKAQSTKDEFGETIDFRAVREQIPALMEKAKEITAAPKPTPKLIKWDNPLDDIPSLEDAIAVLESEGNPTKFAEPKPELFIPPPTPLVPKPAPEIARPTAPPVKVQIAKPTTPPARALTADAPAPKPRPTNEQRPAIDPRPAPQPQPIATQRPSRIEVPITIPDPPRRPQPARTVAEFSPTILGRVATSMPQVADDAGIFTAIDGLTASRFNHARRFVIAGAFAGLAIAAFMLRGEIAGAFAPFDLATVNAPPARTSAPTQAAVPVSNVPDTISPTAVPQPEQIEINNDADEPKPISVSSSTTSSPTKQKPDVVEKITSPPDRREETLRPQIVAKPITPSTLVITSGNSAKKKETAPHERDPFVAPKPATGLTRERVVKNPKP